MRSKQDIAMHARKLWGASPSFYGDKEQLRVMELLTSTDETKALIKESGLEFTDPWHTFHPKLHMYPVPADSCSKPTDKIGIIRLDALQTVFRPHLTNVRSCHKFMPHEETAKAPAGNLSFMMNPFWGSYIFYRDYESSTRIEVPIGDLTEAELGLPNILFGVNVMLGWDSEGIASAFVSRVNGIDKKSPEIPAEIGLPRLLDYLAYTLHLRVYGHGKWFATYRSERGTADYSSRGMNEVNVRTPVIEALITTKLDNGKLCNVSRYQDIEHPMVYDHKGKLLTYELIRAVGIQQWSPHWVDTKKCRTIRPNLYLDDQEELRIHPFSVQTGYRLLHTKPRQCQRCNRMITNNKEMVAVGSYTSLCTECAGQLYVFSKVDETYYDRNEVTAVNAGKGRTDYIPTTQVRERCIRMCEGLNTEVNWVLKDVAYKYDAIVAYRNDGFQIYHQEYGSTTTREANYFSLMQYLVSSNQSTMIEDRQLERVAISRVVHEQVTPSKRDLKLHLPEIVVGNIAFSKFYVRNMVFDSCTIADITVKSSNEAHIIVFRVNLQRTNEFYTLSQQKADLVDVIKAYCSVYDGCFVPTSNFDLKGERTVELNSESRTYGHINRDGTRNHSNFYYSIWGYMRVRLGLNADLPKLEYPPLPEDDKVSLEDKPLEYKLKAQKYKKLVFLQSEENNSDTRANDDLLAAFSAYVPDAPVSLKKAKKPLSDRGNTATKTKKVSSRATTPKKTPKTINPEEPN